MALQVFTGAQLMCSFGTTPSSLNVPPIKQVGEAGAAAATIMDHKPLANIAPFGMCTTVTNPQVAAATSAALGTLTPQPCIPVTSQPWTPGSPTVLIRGEVALNDRSQCMCEWKGLITISNPGGQKVTVP